MKYLLLIYSNAESWDGLTIDQRRALGKGHMDLRTEWRASGKQIGGDGLSDEVNTRTVRVRGGEVITTDGPYVESKEHLAGYYLVDVADEAEAIAMGAQLPDAEINFVEVRPIMDFPAPDPAPRSD